MDPGAESAAIIVIQSRKTLDAESGRLIDRPVVVIMRDRIEPVGTSSVETPTNARVIDLRDATFPGDLRHSESY
jgi:imidazolonepropionase-like amidohydrolase